METSERTNVPRPSDGIKLAPASPGSASLSTGGRGRGQAESRGPVAYALLGRGKMADGKGDATAAAGAGAGTEAPAVAGAGGGTETESMARGHRPASPAPGAPGLRPCLWQLETELREQEVSEVSSLNYCRSFCQVRGRLAGRGWRGGEAWGRAPRVRLNSTGLVEKPPPPCLVAPPGRAGPALPQP